MKICIVNQHTYNHGDEAAKKALLRAIRKEIPQVQLKLVYNMLEDKSSDRLSAETHWLDGAPLDVVFKKRWRFWEKLLVRIGLFIPRFLSTLLFERSSLATELSAMRWADVIVSAPGGVNIGAYRDWKYLWAIDTAVQLRKPTAVYSISIGQSGSKVFDRRAVGTLRKVDFLSLRDVESQRLAGKESITHIKAIDTAFLDAGEDGSENNSPLDNERYAVFVPHDLPSWHPQYRDIDGNLLLFAYKSILEELLRNYGRVMLVPQVFGGKSDESYFNLLRGLVDDRDRVEVVSQYTDSDAQQRLIRRAGIVVGARYHSIVFSINRAVPFVSLSYEHKMTGMLGLLNLGDLDVPISSIVDGTGIDRVTDLISTIARQYGSIRRRVIEARGLARRIATATFERFTLDFLK